MFFCRYLSQNSCNQQKKRTHNKKRDVQDHLESDSLPEFVNRFHLGEILQFLMQLPPTIHHHYAHAEIKQDDINKLHEVNDFEGVGTVVEVEGGDDNLEKDRDANKEEHDEDNWQNWKLAVFQLISKKSPMQTVA